MLFRTDEAHTGRYAYGDPPIRPRSLVPHTARPDRTRPCSPHSALLSAPPPHSALLSSVPIPRVGGKGVVLGHHPQRNTQTHPERPDTRTHPEHPDTSRTTHPAWPCRRDLRTSANANAPICSKDSLERPERPTRLPGNLLLA